MGIANVDLSSFHDAELTRLMISRESKQMSLDYLTEGKALLQLRATGLHAFRAVDVGMQNVVSQILSTNLHEVSETEIIDTLEWISATLDSPPYLSGDVIASYVNKIKKREIFLVIIEPSVGGEICLLAEEVTFSHG